MHRYRVVERVVFEYLWTVESKTPLTREQIAENIHARGDGEADEHDDGEREFLSMVHEETDE